MNKTASISITIALILGVSIVFYSQSKKSSNAEPAQNVEMRDGVQYITITARGGYSPRVSTAQANVPTKLVVKTKGTYDCSSALAIRSINYQKILLPTGEEIIDLGTPKANTTLRGTCSMGMYNFNLNFI